MNIALHSKKLAEDDLVFVRLALQRLKKENVELWVSEFFFNQITTYELVEDGELLSVFGEETKLKVEDQIDLVIALGGDGTLLNSLVLLEDKNIPIVGIHLGRLGFLTSVKKEEINQFFDNLFQKKYTVEQRTLLEVKKAPENLKNFPYALNEIAVLKKDTSSMIDIEVYIDNQFLNSYWADGLIISTPTGSTGYSLSCGGPLLWPNVDCFILTPVCAHDMNIRPIVISNQVTFRLQVVARTPDFLVSMDTRSYTVPSEETFEVGMASHKVNLIRTAAYSYIETLRTKFLK